MSLAADPSSITAAVARPTASTRWALAALSLAMLLASLGISIANIALPALATAFVAPFQAVQWVILAYLLASTALVVGVGRLGDLAGRRRLLIAGLLLFTAASALAGAAPTLWLLIAARALQGLGAAAMLALSMALVGETVAKERIGGAMGLLGTMSAVGTALGPTLGGALVTAFGWPAVFLVSVPLGLIAAFLAYRHLPRDAASTADSSKLHITGILLLAVTLAAYALAMTLGRGAITLTNAALLLAAIVGATIFVRSQAKARSPLIRLALLRQPTLRSGLAMSLLVSTVVMATLVVGPFYLSQGLGLDMATVGLAISVGPIVVALTAVPAGRLADKLGTRAVTLAGLGSMVTGCALLATLPKTLGIAGYVAPIVLVTLGYALFQTANNATVMTTAGPEQRGVISGLLTLSRNLGLITGAAAMGAVFAQATGTTDLAAAAPAAVAGGLRITFAVAGLLVAAALAIAARSPR